jgi:tetratricopeptide (TPR) repeat protein
MANTELSQKHVRPFSGMVGLRLVRAAFLLIAAGLVLAAGGWYYFAYCWKPEQCLRAATDALERRDTEEAQRQLQQCLHYRPRDPRAHFLLARTARMNNELDQAQAELTACEHLQNDKPDFALGDIRLEWALVEAQQGKLLDVEPYLRRRIRERHPDLLFILDVVTWQLMWSWRLEEARACLDIWLHEQPDSYEAHVRHGWVAEHRFQKEQALQDYRHALEIDPVQDFVRLRVAEILVQINHAEEALPEIEAVCRRQSDNRDAILCHARCLRALGREQEAIPLLDNLLTRNANDAQAMAERGIVALGQGHLDQAEGLLRRAVAQDPLNRQINYNLLQCLKRLGKTEETKAIEAQLAKTDASLDRLDKLVVEVMKSPHNANLRYEAGMIFLQNGFTNEGVYWLETALKEDPRQRLSHQALADHYARARDKERAAWHNQFLH